MEGGGNEVAGPELTPDRAYDRRWALTLLQRSVARLRQEYAMAGRIEFFDALRQFALAEKGSQSYGDTAALMGLTESAVKSAVHRLRQRHRQLLRERNGFPEKMRTCGTPFVALLTRWRSLWRVNAIAGRIDGRGRDQEKDLSF